MSFEIIAPALDTNNKTVTVENIRIQNGLLVEFDTELCNVSTPKASEILVAPGRGYIVVWAEEGQDWPVGSILINIYDTEEEARQAIERKNRQKVEVPKKINATSKAKELAQRYGIDLSLIKKDTIIKEKDVQEFFDSRKQV
jgi:pyruvate/2-oxoglutarate dehydrogenase complex dihydrolipoamide acyltransferase (E2) component